MRNEWMGPALAVGMVVSALLVANGCAMFGQHESDEVISMRELPAAVRPLAEKEVAGCRIIEVERENKNGRVVYAITYDQGGVEMEIEYAEDGTLLSKGRE